ncbi:uncharacterized protein LOC131364211 [Hemibagrus wyckioides]|uniref:uncharacterized protein LOC131364211 n=1 Tax=Hemibagrus wyckioides TaxID=337641 RepID=UPI00266D3A84|nr:uncharacterized protein LOC131364211 [Hemibagrus wyckioides]
MIHTTAENSQETLQKENTREGRDKVESRHATDPDKPAGQMDSATGRHVELKSLKDSDPKTSSSLLLLPHPCPPAGAKETHLMNAMKRCSTSLPPEDGPTSPKKRNLCTESLHRGIKTAPSTNPERTKGQKNEIEWNFINETNNADCIEKSDKEVLDYIKQNFNKTSDDRKKDLKNNFLQMLKNYQPTPLMGKKYRQQAFAILKKKENNKLNNEEKTEERSLNYSTEVIGPFYPKHKKHSEDFIIKEINERNNISEVWIYTTNSPCLGRKSHLPCMFNLINLAISRQIKMYIGFSNYYIFNKNMYRFIRNLQDDETRDWNSDQEFQVQFNITEFICKCKENEKIKDNNLITAAYNIIKNILPEYSGLEKTYKDWHQTGSETLAELESTLREEMKERREMMEISDEEFSEITDECKKWWTLSIDENLNRHVVPSILEKIHDFCPNLEFFQVDLEDCLNLANEE